MIDNLAIIISSIAVILVIWRAAVLDGTHPWFRAVPEPPPRPSDAAGRPSRTGRAAGASRGAAPPPSAPRAGR